MTAVDRRFGVYGAAAAKVSCRTVTTDNITLAGLQTIGSLTLVDGDRVLVRSQTDAVENGIYVASSGPWSRSVDFNGPYDVASGTLVYVVGHDLYELSTESPVIGTSELVFTRVLSRLFTNGELFDGDLGTAEGFTAAMQAAADYVGANEGGIVDIPPGVFAIQATALHPSDLFTVTIASPGVVTQTAHGLAENTQFVPLTTGALPTGLTAGVPYYVKVVNANSFQLAATAGGVAINTSGSQSGTHTGVAMVPEANTEEGYGILLTSAHSNIKFRGAGKGITFIKPTTNTIEMFVQLGASNIVFEGITFDNSDNGVLQGELKPGVKVPGSGIAGLGNAANCAIRQYDGASTTVRDCAGLEFHTIFGYVGDYTDDQILSGTATADGLDADGCVFGFLAEQPRHFRYVNSTYINGVNSTNAAGSPNNSDPGHGCYLANRLGDTPLSVIVDKITGYNNQSFTVKIRKGVNPVISNVTVNDSHRGVTVENCQPTLSNINIKLARIYPADTRAIGLKLCNVGHTRTSNVKVDISECDAWAVKVIPTVDLDGTDPEDPQDTNPTAPDWWNVDNQLDGITMINDLSESPDKRWLVCQNQVDLVLNEPVAYVTSDRDSDKPVVYIDNCVRSLVKRPKRRSDPSALGAELLVGITSTSVDTRVEYSRADLDVAPTASTINDAGTDTIVERVDGSITKTWTPVPTFATVGNFAATNVTTTGSWYIRRADEVRVACRLKFDCTQTTASGAFRITGFPYAANGFSNEFVSAVGLHKNLTLASGDVGVVIGNGETFFTLRTNAAGGAGVGPLTASVNFPTTPNVEIGFEITFRITEP